MVWSFLSTRFDKYRIIIVAAWLSKILRWLIVTRNAQQYTRVALNIALLLLSLLLINHQCLPADVIQVSKSPLNNLKTDPRKRGWPQKRQDWTVQCGNLAPTCELRRDESAAYKLSRVPVIVDVGITDARITLVASMQFLDVAYVWSLWPLPPPSQGDVDSCYDSLTT